VQPIGDVGKANRNLVRGGKHGRTPFDALLYHPAT
jgi:hypothetical protein